MTPHAQAFEAQRETMYGIAYRMLGSLSEAEDVVQDAWFRWRRADISVLESPRAWLATMVSRMCIDRLRRRKIEKVHYTGPWLPEPLVVIDDHAPDTSLERAENISFAFLHLLEKLSPLERAVFILKDVFEFSHEDVAQTIDIRPAYSRQLLRRARSKIAAREEGGRPPPDERAKELLASFLEAARNGDLSTLKSPYSAPWSLSAAGSAGTQAAGEPHPIPRRFLVEQQAAQACGAAAICRTTLKTQSLWHDLGSASRRRTAEARVRD